MRTPLLITVDVEIAYDRGIEEQKAALRRLAEDFRSISMTLFVTADAAELFSAELKTLFADGHEIGCHGLDHSVEDDYSRMSLDVVLDRIETATERIKRAIGTRPKVFRGPRMTTSPFAQAALAQLGYTGDLSVCSWRFDPVAASRYRWSWLFLGPKPYLPSKDNCFAKAKSKSDTRPILVLPLSGMLLPFVSGTLFIFGTMFMILVARFLSARSRRHAAPIIYLFHSYEFCEVLGSVDQRPWHHRLYSRSKEDRYAANFDLIRKLVNDLQFVPQTASEYIEGSDLIALPTETSGGDPSKGAAFRTPTLANPPSPT